MSTPLHLEAHIALAGLGTTAGQDRWARFVTKHATVPPATAADILRDLAWEAAIARAPVFALAAEDDWTLVHDRAAFDNKMARSEARWRDEAAWSVIALSRVLCEWALCVGCTSSYYNTLLGAMATTTERSGVTAYPITSENTKRLDAAHVSEERPWGVCSACRRLRCQACGRVLSASLAQPRRALALRAVGRCEQCVVLGLDTVVPRNPTPTELRKLALGRLPSRGGDA